MGNMVCLGKKYNQFILLSLQIAVGIVVNVCVRGARDGRLIPGQAIGHYRGVKAVVMKRRTSQKTPRIRNIDSGGVLETCLFFMTL